MAISRQQKTVILDKLNNNVATQKSVLLLTSNNVAKSLNSELTFKIRKQAHDLGIEIKVVKNTLIQKTFSEVPQLIGPTYLAYLLDKVNSDEITVSKEIVNLVKKEFSENLYILGSVINGSYLDAEQTKVLSKTPSKQDSIAMIAGLLNQFTIKIALTIKEIPSQVSRGVSEYSKTLH
ncbi:MAG: 50S ribosomal protein L10 [candidate division SR1 bacterium]|nr:50S ribosomal protein L10 [candidate division SR1 bacterium]